MATRRSGGGSSKRVRAAVRVYVRHQGDGPGRWWAQVPGRGRVSLDLPGDVPQSEAYRVAVARFAAGELAPRGAGRPPESTIAEIVKAFTAEQAGRYKPGTWNSMKLRLIALEEHLVEVERITLPSQVDDAVCARWVARRQADGLANASINRAILAARVCFRWASTRRPPLCGDTPFVRLPRLREISRERHALVPSPDEWRAVIAAILDTPCDPHYATSASRRERHAANQRGMALLVACAVETGLRIDELRHQRATDVVGSRVLVAAHDGWSPKSWHERTIPVSAQTAERLRELCRWRDGAVGLTGHPIVLGQHWVNGRLGDAWRRCGFSGEPPTIHDARRTFATASVRAGVGLDRVRSLLGHRDVATTERYVGRYRSDAETEIPSLGVSAALDRPLATVRELPTARRR